MSEDNSENGLPALVVAGGNATTGNTTSGQKQCPNCEQFGDSGDKHCWLCGYGFEEGEGCASVGSEVQREDLVIGQAPVVTTIVVATEAEAMDAAQEEAVAPIERAFAGETSAPLPGAIKSDGASGGIVARVVGESPAEGLQTQVTTIGGDVDDSLFGVEINASAAAAASAAPAAPAAGRRRLAKEASALSIPEAVLSIAHPNVPHIVLIVDLEYRRSREGKSLSPPASREPVVIELEDGMMFGRNISACNLDFDPAASTPHGSFIISEEGKYELVDLKSTNGTKLNGDYIEPGQPTTLKDSAVITLGLWTKIIFYAGEASAAVGNAAAV